MLCWLSLALVFYYNGRNEVFDHANNSQFLERYEKLHINWGMRRDNLVPLLLRTGKLNDIQRDWKQISYLAEPD